VIHDRDKTAGSKQSPLVILNLWSCIAEKAFKVDIKLLPARRFKPEYINLGPSLWPTYTNILYFRFFPGYRKRFLCFLSRKYNPLWKSEDIFGEIAEVFHSKPQFLAGTSPSNDKYFCWGKSWLLCEECSQILEFSRSPLKPASKQIKKKPLASLSRQYSCSCISFTYRALAETHTE